MQHGRMHLADKTEYAVGCGVAVPARRQWERYGHPVRCRDGVGHAELYPKEGKKVNVLRGQERKHANGHFNHHFLP